MTRETVQITEEIREAEESLIQIEYYKLSGERPVLHMPPGDLMVICNVLHDYAQMLNEGRENQYRIYAGILHLPCWRCERIRSKIENQMGYSTEVAIGKCGKKHKYLGQEPLAKGNDVGEDALVLAMKQRHQQKKKIE